MRTTKIKTAFAPNLTSDGEAWFNSITTEVEVDGDIVDRYILPV